MGRRTLLLIVSVLIAAIGTALIAIYVRGADARAREGTQQVAVQIAVKTVAAGTKVSDAVNAGAFAERSYSRDNIPTNAISDPADISGLVATTGIVEGATLQRSMFGETANAPETLGIAKDRVGAAFEFTDPQRVAGMLQPGMVVRIYWVPQTGKAETMVKSVKVLRVGQQALTAQDDDPAQGSTNTQNTDQVPRTIVTFDLNDDDERELLAAKRDGELALSILGDQDEDPS